MLKGRGGNTPVSLVMGWMWGVMKQNRVQAFLNTFIGICIVGLDLMFVWCTKLVIDIVTGQSNDFSFSTGAVFLVAVIVLQIAFAYAGRWVRAVLGVKAQNAMQKRVFSSIIMSRWDGLEQFHSGDVLNRIEKDVKEIVDFTSESVPTIITTLIKLVCAFLFLFYMDRLLACILLLMIPCVLLICRLYVNRMRVVTRAVRGTDSEIQSVIQESVQNHTVVKALEQTGGILGKLTVLQQKMVEQVRHRTVYSSASVTVMNIGFSAGYLFTFLWGAHQLQSGLITYGSLMAFIQLVGQIQGPARSLTHYIPIAINIITSCERLMQLENIPKETAIEKPCGDELKKPLGVRLENVTFSYPNDAKEVISRLSFDFLPRTTTAILGKTGSGKTTIARLLLSLITPGEGSVTIYDAESYVVASAATRCHFAYVPQGNTLFSGTIRQNLLLGDSDATDEEMKKALQLACAEFVLSLPEGMETLCGERGYGLSEGQAQRICIARALLRKGNVLLFDEATSALDQTTELQVVKNIQEHFADKTIIIITHRQSLIPYCQQTLWIGDRNDEGK